MARRAALGGGPHTMQRGLATLELALLLPTVVLLVMGAVDLGRMLWTQTVLHHAVQATARYASVRGLASDMPASRQDLEAVFEGLCLSMDPVRLQLQWVSTWPENSWPGQPLQLQASYEFPWSWPLNWATPSVSLQASVSTTQSQ